MSVIYESRLNGKVIDATGGGEAKVMSTGVQGAGDRLHSSPSARAR